MTQSKNTALMSPLPESPPNSPTCQKSTITAASVLKKMQNNEGGCYAATPKLSYCAEYFAGGQKGDILIIKGWNLDDDAEFIIRGTKANDEDNNNDEDSTETLSSEYDIASWPVSDHCKDHLQELTTSHDIKPLPAYDKNHKLIPPTQYESKLNGTLVEVHMAIFHHC
ncbi:hypothetical protein BDR04DRAFT_1118681 [Suillus decipiens]|nr:hypothetical protein BDR04DRAFT_1118681 [Suillus decipiens]